MTQKTIQRKNLRNKEKPSEILRFEEFMRSADLDYLKIQSDTGISNRTITFSIYEKKPLGSKILRKLHEVYGVSIDWLISGVGEMYAISEKAPSQPKSMHYSSDERKERIIAVIDSWFDSATEDEKAWLEIDIKRKLLRN